LESVQTKAGFGAAFALLLGVGIAALIETYAWETSVAWVSHSFEMLGHLDSLSKDPRGPGAEAQAAEIHRLSTDNPSEEKRIRQLRQLLPDLLSGADTTGSAGQIAVLLSAMHQEERRLLDLRMAMQREIALRARRLFGFASALSFMLTLLAIIRATVADKKRAGKEKAIAAREEQYRQLVDNAGDMIFRADERGRFTFWNESGMNVLHYTDREVVARSYIKLIRHDKRAEAERFYLRQFVRRRKNSYCEFPLVDGYGKERWVGVNVQLLTADGRVTGFQGIAREITERKLAETELQKSRDFVERIAATTPGILYVYDMEQRRNIYSNREVSAVLGYRPDELDKYIGDPVRHFHPDDVPALGRHFESLRYAHDGEVRRIEYRARHADGHWVWLAASDTPFERDAHNLVRRIVGIAQDVTARKATQEKLTYQANYDALTGLANRHHFSARLQSALVRTATEQAPTSLCVLDLDNFKETNDRFGHGAGDEVLEAIGNIMRSELRTADFAGRLGGDEFSFVLPGTDLDEAARVAERIRDRLSGLVFGMATAGVPFSVTATFGVAGFHPLMSVKELLEAADKALYKAKFAGRNRVFAEV
jgi:diguanylate cyclase (GGDEF)-like protein/PAS domain S-box-containing protein